MNEQDKVRFINDLVENVRTEILARVAKMPEEWDGHELRRYIADKFLDANMSTYMQDKRSKRYRDYENEVIVRNL